MVGRAFLFLLVLVLGVQPAARADDENVGARVAALLKQAAREDTTEAEEGYRGLEALGWEKVRPHLDFEPHPTYPMRQTILQVAARMGEGEGLFALCLQAMRTRDEDTAGMGIQVLEDALGGYDMWEREDYRPLQWNPAWWRDLLIEMHRTKVVVIDTFYSGPGYPSWNLSDLLAGQVPGREHELVPLTKDADWRVRMMSAAFLATTVSGRSDAVVEALRGLLVDPYARVRQMAVRSVGSSGWPPLVDEVAARLLDPEEHLDVRIEAASRLSGMRPEENKAAHEDAYLRALADADPRVRAAAAEAARLLEPSPPLCMALLRNFVDPDLRVRQGAAVPLLQTCLRGALPDDLRFDFGALLALVSDEDVRVRETALRILTRRRAVPASLVPLLMQRLKSDEQDDKRAAIQALASLGDAARPALMALDAVPDGFLRQKVERAIEIIQMASFTPERLDERARSTDPVARATAAREAVRRRDMPRILAALEDEVPDVALEAAEYLAEHTQHAEAVVDVVIRAFPTRKDYRCHSTLHRMGTGLHPYVDKLWAKYTETGNEDWFGLLNSLEQAAPRLAEPVWRSFTKTPTEAHAALVGRIGTLLYDRLRAYIVTEGPTQQAVMGVVALGHMHASTIRDHYAALTALSKQFAEDDPRRAALDELLEDRRPLPSRPWIEMR